MSTYILPGSERKALIGATIAGPANPKELLQLTLVLRHNAVAGLQDPVERLSKGVFPPAPLTREAFVTQFGARAEDIKAVSKFAAAHHLSVISVNRAARTVVLSGTVRNVDEAFEVKLQRYKHLAGTYRGREGQITLPDTLKDVVQAVLGLDNRPQARANFR